ncbi:hypothetical protein MFU01_85880 [Myxococcus fulvus]|uniref:Uncharacterized protein n=1 Tax=Myxococcus fulvus TaxID=33 RepID=A0A511THC2_MYXFU|nr:hypothetical protein MFU01_85880 [Myxococcus fulvus]
MQGHSTGLAFISSEERRHGLPWLLFHRRQRECCTSADPTIPMAKKRNQSRDNALPLSHQLPGSTLLLRRQPSLPTVWAVDFLQERKARVGPLAAALPRHDVVPPPRLPGTPQRQRHHRAHEPSQPAGTPGPHLSLHVIASHSPFAVKGL